MYSQITKVFMANLTGQRVTIRKCRTSELLVFSIYSTFLDGHRLRCAAHYNFKYIYNSSVMSHCYHVFFVSNMRWFVKLGPHFGTSLSNISRFRNHYTCGNSSRILKFFKITLPPKRDFKNGAAYYVNKELVLWRRCC